MEKIVNVLVSLGIIACGISVFKQAEEIGVEIIALLIVAVGVGLMSFVLKEKKEQR